MTAVGGNRGGHAESVLQGTPLNRIGLEAGKVVSVVRGVVVSRGTQGALGVAPKPCQRLTRDIFPLDFQPPRRRKPVVFTAVTPVPSAVSRAAFVPAGHGRRVCTGLGRVGL